MLAYFDFYNKSVYHYVAFAQTLFFLIFVAKNALAIRGVITPPYSSTIKGEKNVGKSYLTIKGGN